MRACAISVVERLSEAGRTLVAMPSVGTRPATYGSGWPEMVTEAGAARASGDRMRPGCPDARSISRMDEAFAWLRHIPEDRRSHRRIVLMRSLCDPMNGRNLYSWRRIGKACGWSHEAVRNWHEQAIDWIVAGLNSR